MKKQYRSVTSLSAPILGVIALLAAGCADSEEKPATGTQKAAITSRGVAVNGCSATALFDITNNAESRNKSINTVAVDQSAINEAKSQLFTKNSQNQLTKVEQESSTVSEDTATALSEFTSNTNAFQRSLAEQSAKNTHLSKADTTTTVTHTDSADTFNKSFNEVINERSGSQRSSADTFNRAFGDQRSSSRADSSRSSENFVKSNNESDSFQLSASFISNDLGGFDAFGMAGFNATNISNVAQNSRRASNRAVSANSAMANNSVANMARNSFLTVADTSRSQASEFFNSSRSANEQQSKTSVANASTSTSTRSMADAVESATRAKQESRADQSADSKQKNATSSMNAMSAAQSFKNLSESSSQNFVLQLNFTANSNEASTSVFALNENNQIIASNNFSFSFPNCGGASIRHDGMIRPPAEDGSEAATIAPARTIEPALAKEEERE